MSTIPRALTIAGSDSGGGAGIQADLKTFSAFGVYGMSVITAVTAQNTVCVHGVEPLSPRFISLQIEAVLSDIGVDGVKTGMLFDAGIVQTVTQKIQDGHIPFVVVDPVMIAKGGDTLLDLKAVDSVKNGLIPAATLVTPNIPEAEILSDISIKTLEDMKEAAFMIRKTGCQAVLVKGGHLEGDAVDLLFDGEGFTSFPAKRINASNTHGTGCTYSAAILANLIKGIPLKEAILRAKLYVTKAIETSFSLGKGHGPLNHFVKINETGS